jgi:hypothetical protein
MVPLGFVSLVEKMTPSFGMPGQIDDAGAVKPSASHNSLPLSPLTSLWTLETSNLT